MTIIDDDVIDAPWWPGFPELPNLVRKMLGKPLVAAEGGAIDATNLEVVPLVEVPQVRKKAERAAFIERSRFVPGLVKLLFAHNAYVLACKPRYRRELGL